MANIKREIETLRAKIARLEKEQKKSEQQQKALSQVQSQIDKILKENGITFEAYIRSQQPLISRLLAKIERVKGKAETPVKRVSKKKVATKKRRPRKAAAAQIKIPAGQYGNLPADPAQRYVVKEKGPRPKALKAYAEEIGLEAFLAKCRIGD